MTGPAALTAWGLLATFVLIFLHVPIGVAMGAAGVVGFGLLSGFHPAFAMVASEASNTLASPDLATIPLFILMGAFASAAGLSEDLYRSGGTSPPDHVVQEISQDLEGIGPVRTYFVEVEDLAGPPTPVPDPAWPRRVGETVAILGRGLRYKVRVPRPRRTAPAD